MGRREAEEFKEKNRRSRNLIKSDRFLIQSLIDGNRRVRAESLLNHVHIQNWSFNWRVDKLIKPFPFNLSPLTSPTTKTMFFKLDAVYLSITNYRKYYYYQIVIQNHSSFHY